MPKKRNENIIEQNTPAGDFRAIDIDRKRNRNNKLFIIS